MDELREKKEAVETGCDEITEELNYEKNLNKELVIKVKDFERTIEGKNTEISHLSENIENISLDYKFLLKENIDFENDIQDLMKVKIEQEERVNEAEEALKSELKMVRSDYCELQQRLLVIESEKDNLQKKVSKLEQKHVNLLKESIVACDVTTSKYDESKSILNIGESKEGRCSKKELSTHISNYNDEQKHNKLLSEISSLDERNKHMEKELKEMQEKYSEVSLRFAEVESERQQLVMALRNKQNGKKK